MGGGSLRCCLFALASVALPCGVARAQQARFAPAPSADELFARARDRWNAEMPPGFISYTVVVRVRQNQDRLERHYRGSYTAFDGRFDVRRFSEEERAAGPAVAHGIDVIVTLPGGGGFKLSHDPKPTDFLGYPELSPRYAFGLERSRAGDDDGGGTDARLRVIGGVRAEVRRYDVRLADDETIDGHECHHLALQPLEQPQTYRLRDLWIDTSDASIRRIVTAGNFTSGPSLGARWTIDYEHTNGVSYIATEHALEPLRGGPRDRYDDYAIAFEDLAASKRPPSPLLTVNLPSDGRDLREPDSGSALTATP